MAVSPALTNSERSALAGISTIARYLSPVPDVDIATARINQASFTYPLFQLTIDNTSAGWTDVQAGDTVYIGTSAGARDIGVYRVRLTPGSTTLYIGQVASQDAGLLATTIRTASFADNNYVTVKRRYDIWSVLPVINAATGQIYEDGTLVPGTNNTTPPPLVDIVINNRRNHLATLIENDTTFALSAAATPASWPTSSGETYDYAWTVPPEWTGVSGDDTDTLTADVPPGNYILECSVTGSLSGATTRISYVHIHDDDDNPPLLISEMPRTDTRDRTGRRISLDLYSNRLTGVTDGAACIYFEMATWANQWRDSDAILDGAIDDEQTDFDVDDGSLFAEDDMLLIDGEQMQVVSIAADTLTVTRAYNGTTADAHADASVIYVYAPATDVPTATRQMVGWALRYDRQTSGGLRQAALELVSPTFLLAQLNSTSQIITAVSSPTTWQEVKPALATASFLAWYMLKWRCANLLTLFDFTPFSTAATGQRKPEWVVNTGTLLQQIQQLATERGNFGANSEGSLFFLRHPNLKPYPRSSTVTRDTLDASLYASASNPQELTPRVSQVRGEAFWWDGSAPLPTPGYSDSPKTPGQGGGQIKLASQVVTDQAELEQITGDRYAQGNNPFPTVTYRIQRNRDVYEPAEMQLVAGTIPAELSATDDAWTGSIIPAVVNKTHNADGTSDIELTGEGETHNLPGDFVPVPEGNESIYSVPFMPLSIDPLPELSLGDFASITVPTAVPSPQGPTVSPGRGAIWVSADGTKIQRTFDISTEPPVIDDVTPTDAFFTAFVMVVHDKSDNFSRGAYALGNDGTNSKVAYTTDIYADSVVWESGEELDGLYTVMESAGQAALAGGVAAYNAADGIQYYTTTPQANVDLPGNNTGVAVTSGDVLTLTATGLWRYGPPPVYPEVDADGDSLAPAPAGSPIVGNPLGQLCARVGTTGAWTAIGVSGGFTAAATGDLYLILNDVTTSYGDNSGELDVRIALDAGASTSTVATSTDYGGTFATETVGDSPAATGAFCLSRFGKVALAAIDATLKKATSFGGTFGSVTGGGTTGTYPIAARIPWFKIGKKSMTNNSTSPDFYLASAAAIAGDTLWKVIAGTPTAITPDVMGTEAVGVSPHCIGTYGATRICFIGDVSGDVYAFSSKNSGSTWTANQIDNAVSVRAQRFSPSGLIWILAAGVDGIYYSDDGGVTWQARTAADGAAQAELMG